MQARFGDKSQAICAGVEMEFNLLSDERPAPAASLATGTISPSGDTLSAHQLDDYDNLFADINTHLAAQDIKLDTITSELGRGQYEITFAPKNDLVTLADHILIFKYLIKGLAKSYGIRASFMAKPLMGEAGNGCMFTPHLLMRQAKIYSMMIAILAPKPCIRQWLAFCNL